MTNVFAFGFPSGPYQRTRHRPGGCRLLPFAAAPYHVSEEDRQRITWWAEQPPLRAAFGTGWYGHGTTQIVLWRTDRIPEVNPAGREGTRDVATRRPELAAALTRTGQDPDNARAQSDLEHGDDHL